jgi:hypothetical protein
MNRRTILKMLAAQAVPRIGSGIQARTAVEIAADRFLINGRPTYAGRTWRGMRIEGLLMNSRMVQGIFDDLNPATRDMWVYPDTERWDPDRNTREFVAAMPEWRRHGLLAFAINLQGGQPTGLLPGSAVAQQRVQRGWLAARRLSPPPRADPRSG